MKEAQKQGVGGGGFINIWINKYLDKYLDKWNQMINILGIFTPHTSILTNWQEANLDSVSRVID